MIINYIAEEVGSYRFDVWSKEDIDCDSDWLYALMGLMTTNECMWIVPGTITE